MKKWIVPMIAAVLLGVPAMAGECKEKEHDICIDTIPRKVMMAAKKAVPGIVIEEAEMEHTDTGLIYEIEGHADGKEYELNITAKGKVVTSTVEDDDDGEDDDHGEDDDDDDDDDHDD